MPNCSLCQIVSGGSRWPRLYEDELLVVVLDRRSGCVLIVPKAHRQSLAELGAPAQLHLEKIGQRARQSLDDAGAPVLSGAAQLAADPDTPGGHAHLSLRAS